MLKKSLILIIGNVLFIVLVFLLFLKTNAQTSSDTLSTEIHPVDYEWVYDVMEGHSETISMVAPYMEDKKIIVSEMYELRNEIDSFLLIKYRNKVQEKLLMEK